MKNQLPEKFKILDWDELAEEVRKSDYLYSYFEAKYHHELSRRTEISNLYFNHISILAIIAGGFLSAGSMLIKYEIYHTSWFLITAALISIGVISLLISGVYALRTRLNPYGYMPDTISILRQANDLVPYLRKVNPEFNSSRISQEMSDELKIDLTRFYAEYAALNSDSNRNKTMDITTATNWKAVAILLCTFSFVSVFCIQVRYDDREKPTGVSIESITKSADSVLNKSTQQPSKEVIQMKNEPTPPKATQAPSTQPQTPARPVMQGGQILTESTRPRMQEGYVSKGDTQDTSK